MALLDCGSARSLINKNFSDALGLQVVPSSVALEGANGQPLIVQGQAKITVTVDGQTFTHPFIVVPHLEADQVLLGNDFLERSQAVIDWARNSFQVTVNKPTQRVRLLRQVVVPPRSRMSAMVKTTAHQDAVIVSGTRLFSKRYGLNIEPMLIDDNTNCFCVIFVNPSSEPVAVPAHATVGLAEAVEDVEDMALNESEVQQVLHCSSSDNAHSNDHSSTLQSPGSLHQTLQVADVSITVGGHLTPAELSLVREFFTQHLSSFARSSTDVGYCRVQTHAIPTKDSAPIAQRPRRLSAAQRDLVKAMIKDLIDAGLVRPSRSAWASPLVLVKKKDGSTRMCVDYRRLNAVTEDCVYPFPLIEDALQALTGSKYFSVMDLASGFHQIPMKEEDIEKTAFVAPWGLYEYLRMPFGLKGAPFTCQRAVDAVINDAKYDYALVYMDDCVVYSKTFHEHLDHLKTIFARFREADLKFKPQKCFFFCAEITYLGHVITTHGVSPDPAKIAAVQDFQPPTNGKELQSFLGLTSYFRKFIPRYSALAAPLRALLKKDTPFLWTEEHATAFFDLKEVLCGQPVLKLFSEDPSFAVQVHTDASRLGLGAVLLQADEEENFRPVVYLSRALKGAEANYTSTELEALAVKWSLDQLRPYLIGRKFSVVTDHHALCWLLKYKEGNQRLLRWSLSLQEFDFEVIYKTGRLHYAPDCLSRLPFTESSSKVRILQVTDGVTSLTDIPGEQRRDTFCHGIIELLHGQSGTRKQQRRARKKFLIHGDVLYRVDQGPVHQRFLMCLPQSQVDHVLRELHGGKYGAHMGIRRTYEAVRAKYYWPKAFSAVKKFVQHCDLCQRYKVSTFSSGLLQPVPVHAPFHTVGLDIIGPFKSSRRYKYIIVAIDYLTKFVEAKPVRNIEATTVQNFIERRLILKHGCPTVIITDRGTQMMAKSTETFLRHRGIRHSPTTAYHPAANGLCERVNKTIKQMMTLMTAEGEKWADILPYAVFCYNTGYQESVQQSPFFLVYGRDPILPLDVVFNRQELAELQDASNYTALVHERLSSARKLAADNIKLAQERQKLYFDRGRKDVILEKGQLVLLRSPPVGLKGSRKFTGPFRVVARLSPVNYEIETEDSSWSDVVHIEKLKPYLKPLGTYASV